MSSDAESHAGAGVQVGAGLDKRFGSRFALGVALDGYLSQLGGGVRASYWDLSMTFAWY